MKLWEFIQVKSKLSFARNPLLSEITQSKHFFAIGFVIMSSEFSDMNNAILLINGGLFQRNSNDSSLKLRKKN